MAETHKWNKSTKTGWKKEGGKWVQYKKGQKTGVNKSNLYIGSRLVNTLKRTKRNIAAVEDLPSKSKGGSTANAATVTKSTTKTTSKTPVSDHAKTGHTKLVKGKDGKVKRVKVSNTTKDKTLKGSDTSKMKGKDQGDGGRADWLKKTRNSPAAKSKNNRGKPTFSDEERWQQQLKHRAWKEGRKKGNKKKDNLKTNKKPTNPVEAQSGLKKKKKKKATNPIGLQFGR